MGRKVKFNKQEINQNESLTNGTPGSKKKVLSRTKAKKLEGKLVFPKLGGEDDSPKKLSSRQKSRLRKRKMKEEVRKDKMKRKREAKESGRPQKKRKTETVAEKEEEDENDETLEEESDNESDIANGNADDSDSFDELDGDDQENDVEEGDSDDENEVEDSDEEADENGVEASDEEADENGVEDSDEEANENGVEDSDEEAEENGVEDSDEEAEENGDEEEDSDENSENGIEEDDQGMESFDEVDDDEVDDDEVPQLFGSDDEVDINEKFGKYDSDDSDSEGWSEAEREADELEAEDGGASEDEEDASEIPSYAAVLEEIQSKPNIEISQARSDAVLAILSDFKNKRGGGRPRSEYMNILKADLCLCFTYNKFLMDKFMELVPLKELKEFLTANAQERPVTIRTNTLKTRRKQLNETLSNRGLNVEAIPWSRVGLVVYGTPSNLPVGATPEYLAGHYMLQGASSFLPVMSLAPKENEFILDMCAAPGGKSTHIASMMKNTGVLYCNDANPERIKALTANIHRMGINNTIISCMDGRKVVKKLENSLDRVLLDAPCTGTGIISKDERVKFSKQEGDVKRCAHLQVELLLASIDAVNAKSTTGGYVVYSTCSLLVEENEAVLNSVLQKRDVKLVPTGLQDIGDKGFTNFKGKKFHPSCSLLHRIYPHRNNMDGFCIAKLKKLSNKKPNVQS